MSATVDPDKGESADNEVPTVAVCETTPGRVVFTEDGNSDGWIATDLTVSLSR
ncbi:hypothetical protein [Natranaeroarchaeum sulfidigenes]|uniref:Uncharacterized protein n=1 Tax=Natranaeroarchaeum sulfidigenes TaxID=2784880 RepID=A0A897MY60_9EURY|nr:hypothetical protein [Natranaeroarchaeum sulfidigenes]QSG03066.1 Uncharacterized protein AArcS_1858 [Natranaeroarchaeum sulfidigenes]